MDDYKGIDRRASDKAEDTHRRITERHTNEIASVQSEVSGLKVGLTNTEKGVNNLTNKVDTQCAKEEQNWTAIGSLIVAILIVFGGIFGFLFNSQSNSTEATLINVQRESDLRHEIRDLHEKNLTNQVVRLQDRVLTKLERQEELNLEFSKAMQSNTGDE